MLRLNFLYPCIPDDVQKTTFCLGSVRVNFELFWDERVVSWYVRYATVSSVLLQAINFFANMLSLDNNGLRIWVRICILFMNEFGDYITDERCAPSL